ncbi:dopamine receptor D2a [Triplophysa rosa]|uniref:Dopamine D2 receptor n=1 Tax=Triplophysa rosa TaxID=992332 RepID=A0A9W7WKK9_TRIRA|nr:dopamine receptor D2a [Triplophysa rosa]KAI7800823.1 dopamine D2 receptor [Triplophysa rosa]
MDVFMQYAYNESFFENVSQDFNATGQEGRHQYNYYAMLLTLLIFVIVFGNVLVCMAVSREKALQTTTNYLIVSLAVADLLVATLVMPWVVYLEVVGEWRFSTIHCDIFVTLDVMMCTASILNLCAISIDRYTAVAMPMLYNTRYSSKRRVTVMISVVWVLSFAISCPLLFGLNNSVTHDDALCVIANPAFVVYSSIVSFYVPFIITLLVYVQIYVVLRKRRKRVNTKRTFPVTDVDMSSTIKRCTHPDDVKLCTVIVKSSGNFPVNNKNVIFIKEVVNNADDIQMDEISNLNPPRQKKQDQCGTSQEHSRLVNTNLRETDISPPSPEAGVKPERNGNTSNIAKVAKAFEIQVSPNGKTQTSVKSLNKRKISQQKEKKATQMLAIVLGVFIICWLPFFITHIVNTYCQVPPELYTAFTWLGYVNSAVNPIIYTTFNIEFRKAFIKILHC